MTSEFNQVQAREKYQDFDRKIKEQMPLILADNRYPMFATELFEQRLQGRGISRYLDTSDLMAQNGPKSDDQEIKFILTANRNGLTDIGRFALGLINTQSEYSNGAVNLAQAKDTLGNKVTDAYDRLQGNGVIAVKRKELGILDKLLTQDQVLNHKGWRILARHPEEVPKEFAEDFEAFKEYAGKVVFSRYDKAMGIYLANGEEVPTLRAWYVDWLDGNGRSDANGNGNLGFGSGRLVGVAPEAPVALGIIKSKL